MSFKDSLQNLSEGVLKPAKKIPFIQGNAKLTVVNILGWEAVVDVTTKDMHRYIISIKNRGKGEGITKKDVFINRMGDAPKLKYEDNGFFRELVGSLMGEIG